MPETQHPYSIEASGLVKRYRVYASPLDRLKEVLCFNRRCFHREFTALRDVELAIRPGATVGVVGPNGAGKSTLLKILAGIITPSGGKLAVRGKVASIIELGTGFHPDFTGRENARINAAVLGFDQDELAAALRDVIEFSELGKYIDMPVRTYSSGMFARLAFSIAINARPDVLLIDEALAVGDAIFTQRCILRIRQLQQRGVTIFFVSHDTNAVRGLCSEALLIDRGEIAARGDPKQVIQQYEIMVAQRLAEDRGGRLNVEGIGAWETPDAAVARERRFGTFEARIVRAWLEDDAGRTKNRFLSGETARFRLRLAFDKDLDNPVLGLMLRNRFGVEVFGTNTHYLQIDTGGFRRGVEYDAQFRIPLNLGNGVYQVSYALHTPDNLNFDYRVDCDVLEILGVKDSIGLVPLETGFTIQPVDGRDG